MNRWERNARNRNRKRDRKMPLLAHAGIADQVVPDWTPEAVERHITNIVEAYHAAMAEGQRRTAFHTDYYIFQLRLHDPELDLEEIQERFERRFGAASPEYLADYWCEQLASHTGRSKLEAFNDATAAYRKAVQ